ncbi:MAG: copper amine oxidase N-terminal domain-containing protein [Oscillospiraceae bacterium]|nr:copper amine oxidase N-terminal domain-containing protein [Oscillospiraceae bacterium]
MKKNLKKLIACLLILSMALASSTALAATNTPKIAIDGQTITIPTSYGTPYIDSAGRTQVPIRIISEKLGFTVSWNQTTSTATINGDTKIKIGNKFITTPYGTVTMDTAAIIKDGRTYVPIRFLANALGYDVSATTSNGVITANIITKVTLNISAASSLRNALTAVQKLCTSQKSPIQR